MNPAARVFYSAVHDDEFCCSACSCTELSLLSVETKTKCGFLKKNVENVLGKKSFLLVLLYIVYTNYHEY